MICLYNKNESDFTYNGLGTLEPIECLFSCVINDVWKVEMTLPYDPEGKYKKIDNDMLLKITDIDAIAEQTSSYQLFRIYDYRKEDTGLFVAAYPVGLDARHDTYGTVTSSGKTAAQAIAQINGVTNKYTVSTDIEDSDKHTATWSKTNIIAMLNGEESFTSTWGGEIAYDNYNIKVNTALGRASGVGVPEVRYGKNIRGMSVEYDTSNVITRLYLYANSGEAYQSPGYVDAVNASDYPIPHISYLVTPFNLIQTTDDGTEAYIITSVFYDMLKNNTAAWVRNYLLTTWLKTHELKWLVDNYALTMEKDGTQGICEYMWQEVVTASGVTSNSVKSFMYKAMKEGFDEVLKTEGSDYYIGSPARSLKAVGGGSEYVYTYSWDTYNEYIYRPFSNTYVWIYASNKWNQLNANGVTTGATDTGKWKWYKVSGKTWKRFGNKNKKRYLHDQDWEVNDVWYQFASTGEGVSGTTFLNARKAEFYYGTDSQGYTFIDALSQECKDYEDALFDALYLNMSTYAMDLFTTERLAYPVPNISIDVVDLSKTTEYVGMESLLRFKLGDTVRCINTKLGIETNLRVTGIVYDCIRKCNNQLTIGMTDNDLVNMFMKIGEVTDIDEYTAGDGIVINNKTISALPQGGITDVIIGGQSVTYGGKAVIDIDAISGEGLQWFEETEDALFGVTETEQTTYMKDDDSFRLGADIRTGNDTYRWTLDVGGEDVFTVFVPKSNDYPLVVQHDHGVHALAEQRGALVIAKTPPSMELNAYAYNYTPTKEGYREFGYGDFDLQTDTALTIYNTIGSGNFATNWIKVCTDTVTIDGVTWYGAYVHDYTLGINNGGYNSSLGSIASYLAVEDFPIPNVGFENVADMMTYCITASKTIEKTPKYNGISREGNLAFFAGGSDEHGTDAPIKIYSDGTYEGIGGVNDVKVDNVSVVTDNVAYINTMTGATSQDDGEKGLVPAPTTSDEGKYLKGDGTWDIPTGTTYNDFAGSAHGLVPPVTTQSGKFLKDDGTWGTPSGGGGGGGGDTVTITPKYSSGIEIAEYSINGVIGKIYVPRTPIKSVYSLNINQIYYDMSTMINSFNVAPTTGYEGITYQLLDAVEIGKTYKVSFDYINRVTGFSNRYPWRCELSNSLVNNYNVTVGTANLPKTLTSSHIELTLTATATTIFLVFYLADATGSGIEEISNFVLEEVTS